MDRIKKLVNEKLCKKGQAYRKRRMAAGEKSSAYLSGRAVKVCNGTMSGKKKKKTNEQEENDNRVAEAALILPRGEKVVLQAEEQDYKRGLIVELTDEGGYKINYWYGDDVKIYPAEVEVDGVSIKDDANEVYIKFHPELKENITEEFDELDDGFDKELESVLKGGIKLHPSRLKDIVYYIHNNWMAGNYGDDYAINRISKFLNPINENTAPNHNGKSAPYGSGYKELNIKKISESLRDWFKKENWVRINTSGNISGDCGTMKKGKATTRCLPKKKAQSLTKAERKATVAKKVRGDKKGKQFVKNTKKAEFKKK